MIPAIVRLSMRRALGLVEGRTLSVADDMTRKSLAVMMITISKGVRMACPVINKPAVRNSI